MASTPTPSEFGDLEDSWYDFAWWIWLAAQDRSVTQKQYVCYAMALDEVPGAGEYFRWLCQYDLYLVPLYVCSLSHRSSKWFSSYWILLKTA